MGQKTHRLLKIPQDWYTARLIMERWGHGGLVTLGFHE